MKDDKSLLFNQLIDISAIDFPSREYRFDVFYLFSSLTKNQRILIKISLKIDDFVESITPLYFAANWYERECYDLFGIQFKNHKDAGYPITTCVALESQLADEICIVDLDAYEKKISPDKT